MSEILATLTTDNKNRGLLFDGEMMPYCGGHYQVKTRVEQIIDEATGKMIRMKNPCIILEGVVCQARYSECRLFCPRAIYPYWREVWLERSPGPPALADTGRQARRRRVLHRQRRRTAMALIIRIDVDRPYGRQPVLRHVLSRLSSDLYFPQCSPSGT